MSKNLMKPEITDSSEPSNRNPVHLYLATLHTQNSRDTQVSSLNRIVGILTGGACSAEAYNWQELRYEHVMVIYNALIEMHYKPSVIKLTLSALKGVLTACGKLGLMTLDDYRQVTSWKSVMNESLPVAGRKLSADELLALLRACREQTTPAGARDAAIILVMAQSGLRREAVTHATLTNYDRESGRLLTTNRGCKEHVTYMTDETINAIADWLTLRGDTPGALFCSVDMWGRVYPDHELTGQAIYKTLEKRGKRAGLKHFSPQDLRRTCINNMLDAGIDLVTVSKVVGHRDPRTTAHLGRRPDRQDQH